MGNIREREKGRAGPGPFSKFLDLLLNFNIYPVDFMHTMHFVDFYI